MAEHVKCIHELFEAQADATPDAIAVVCEQRQLTYRELDERATRLACELRRLGVAAEVPVTICVSRSLEMVVGVLAILKAGGCYVPLDPTYPADRLAWMIEDTAAPVLLTEKSLLPGLPEHQARVVLFDEALDLDAGERIAPVSVDQLAIVLYTSGSTGRSKGVAMSHRSLSYVIEWQARRLQCGSGTRTAQFASLSFDVSFLEMFSMLCYGGTVVVLSEAVRQDPVSLWNCLIEERIEILFVPFVGLQQLAQVGLQAALHTPARPAHLREIASSGEQLYITPDVVRLFETLPHTILDNLYGPTESHAAMEFRLEGPPDSWPKRPPIGRSIVHSEIYLLDQDLNPISAEDVDGEIYIGGHGLARGYLGRPDLTAGRFLPDPFSNVPGARMYRTGDSARYVAGGVLEFTGRIDHQLKIRGFRVEPEEVEAEINRHPAIRNAVVIGWANGNGEKRLAAYFVTEDGESISSPALRKYLESKLPEYMVPSVFIPLEVLPVSPNGKLDRRALPLPTLSRAVETEYVAPRTELEKQLSAVWTDVLGLDEIGIDDNFFELGGHSLLAATLLTRLREVTGSAALSMRRLFESPTIAELAQAILEESTLVGGEELPELTPDPLNWNEPFPLADMQQAYWIGRSGAFELGQVATHLYLEIESSTVTVDRLETVIQKLVQRHPMLRAVILPDGQQQVLENPPPYKVRTQDLQGLEESDAKLRLAEVRQAMSHQVIPAHEWPWFEVRASRFGDGRVLFHVSYDLLIGDLGSLQILISELTVLLENPEAELPELKVSFRDYILAEAALQDLPAFQEAKAYWLQRLAAMPAPPELPLARHPSAIVEQRFMRRSGRLEPGAWQKLQARARQHNVTPTVVLLTAYAEIVNAWSASSRFTINLPIQNRLPLHPQINGIVGEFSSLSLLAVDNSERASFAARAHVVQKQLWEDLSHRHYSGTRVMREWSRRYSGTSSAVMPVVFTSALNLELSGWITGAAEQVVYSTLQTPQVWLDNQVGEHAGALNFNWDAVDGLFPAGMFDGMFDAYCRLLHQLAEHEDTWSNLDLAIAPMVEEFPTAPISEALLHELFLEQARENPQRTAVITANRELTYGELDQRSHAIAARVRSVHTGNSRLVAIVMDKGWEQIAAALGILRAGLAYVPIDPQLPESRRLGLLKDAGVEVVLTQPSHAYSLNWPDHVSVLIVGEDDEDFSGTLENVDQHCTDLAYVIYTSGSTGFPKGVMIDHRGAVNTILDINNRFNVTASDRVLGLSSLSFDLSVYDIFGTLAAGGAIVLPAPDGTRDPSSWAELIQQFGVTIWDTVPALMEMLVEYLEHSESVTNKLRIVMLSGDWIPVSLPRRIKNFFKDAELFSLGGATEASIWSIMHRIEDDDSLLPSIPYGRSMTNQSIQVLNETLQRCPAWVAGELFIGGIGVALGYWNDEAKTRASFITHPNGERLYRTGDIGRYLPNGEIEFLGRRDLQVKVQGFRIELGEIEATLLQHERVRSAVVAVAGDTSFEKRLVAFLVVENGSIDEIKEFLRTRLAPHMIPSEFNLVDEIPITSNGKVDRKALFALKSADAKSEVTAAAALTDTEKVLASVFAELLGIDSVETHVNFFDLGMTSLHIVRAHNRLRTMLAEPVPIVQFFKYPTIKSLAANLKQAQRGPNGVGYVAVEDSAARVNSTTSSDIAVVGMSCRFPGARNVDEFLRNLREGVESMSQFSDEELLASGISPELLRRPDYVKAGSVLEGIDEFDANFFGISPREAEMTDPQQRIFLETAWEALEDAGCDPRQYRGSIGVFAGSNLSTYLMCNFNTRFANTIPGLPLTLANDKDYLATRVSYKLNLRGPSLTVQTACSTSLVAIHVACQNLLTGDCDVALAGGVTINVPHKTGYQYQAGGPVSPDGHCRPFDANAQGTVLGNGVGIVVLKRLDDAVRDNDRIVAVIKGSAINNDGSGKVGFTAPSVEGQTEVIARALQRASVSADTIGYVETHGTATPLGDPIEIEALSRVFGSLPPSSCAIGSVKSNLGHLDSAAGVAGFIKAALSLQHAELFPSLNYSTPNPQIDFERTPFYVNTALSSWATSEKRRAGVSSFGIGGTNAHVVIEEWREAEHDRVQEDGFYVLPLSARDEGALRELAARYVERLAGDEALSDLCYSASVRRAHHRERLAVVGRTAAELRAQLDAYLSGEPTAGVFAGKAAGELGVVYVFSGQGAQWWGMGRELAARFPEFRASLAECDELLWQRTQEWRLLEELERGPEDTRLDGEEIELTQCALFALQVSLARLWTSYGLRPAAAVGHSMGEVAAAVASGVLTLAEGVEVIFERSRLLRHASGRGTMAAVELGEAEAEAAVAGRGALVSVAAVNGKRASVVSGAREAVQELLRELETKGVMVRELRSSGVAGHSAEVADISEALVGVLGQLRGRASDVRLVSTVSGRAVNGEEVDANYWGRNVREQVRFRAAMQELAHSGDAVYIEMNAHPVLGLWIREAVEEANNKAATVVAALRRERSEAEVTLTGLAELYAAGVSIDWEALWRGRSARFVNLPNYPWQRRRFWVDESNTNSQSVSNGYAPHSLLGKRITSPSIEDFVFETHFNVATNTLLNDHRVYGVPIAPATIYIELALAAASEVFRERSVAIEDFVIQGPMILTENESRTVQVIIGTEREGTSSFRVFSTDSAAGDKWTLHASGSLVARHANVPHEHFPLVSVQSRIVEPVALDVLAARTTRNEVEYGPTFQGIKGIWSGNNEALGYIELSETPDAYRFHPALLDLCFQIVEATRTGDAAGVTYLPLSVERFNCFAQPGQAVWSYAYIRPEENSETMAADVVIFDENGNVIAEVEELRFKRATKESLLRGWHGNIGDWFYEVDWKPAQTANTDAAATGRWLICSDDTDFANELSTLLRTRGGEPFVVTSAQNITEFINAEALRGIVYLWSTGSSPDENTSSNTMMYSLRSCCERVLHLLRDVAAAGANDVPRLTIVTRGAQQPATPSSLVQSSLWGLSRTIALEHPELNVSLIDLPDALSSDDARNVFNELFIGGDQVSFRNGHRHVARLTRPRNMQLPDSIALREDATYAISGAFGGLGPKLLRWMFENGARHFVLIGRRGPSAEAQLVLDDLESQGAKFLLGQADVSDVDQLANVLANAESQLPPLRGVIHAALVLDDGVLLKLGWESFDRVFAAKAAGAWNLHLLTRDTPLDFFVCFSSVLALLGGSGQANYAAASTFVDALAHYRRAAGLPALSVNWGPWSFAGSASLEVIEQHSQLYDGFTSIPVESGFEVFGRLLSTTQSQIGVMPFDAAQWGEIYPAVGATFLADVISEKRKSSSKKETPTLTSDALLKAAPSERQSLLGEYLKGIIARRLGVSPVSLDVNGTFINLGLDSLMMLEIRNRIVDDLGLIIPPVKFIENPSVAQLTTAAYERWLEVNGPTDVDNEPDLDELRSRLPLLSDEEVEESLRALLATAN